MLNWEYAKNEINKMKFPADFKLFRKADAITAHWEDKKRHGVTQYKTELPKIAGYDVDAEYVVCSECPRHVISKKVMLFDNVNNLVYIRKDFD